MSESAAGHRRVLVKLPPRPLPERLEGLERYANACLYLEDRAELFAQARARRLALRRKLRAAFRAVPAFAAELGIDPARSFEVHDLRPTSPDPSSCGTARRHDGARSAESAMTPLPVVGASG